MSSYWQEPSDEEKDEIDACVKRFESMIKNGKKNVFFEEEEYLYVIEHYIMEHNFRYASLALELALSMYPGNIPLLLRRVSLLSEQQHKDKALQLMKQIDTSNIPDDADTLYEKAMLYSELQQWDLSEKKFNKILNLPGREWKDLRNDFAFYYDIAEMYASKGDFLKALNFYIQSWDMSDADENSATITYLLCKINDENLLEKAENILKNRAEKYPMSEYTWICIGKIELDLSNYIEAEYAYEQSLAISNHIDSILDLNAVYILQNKNEEAEALMSEYAYLNIDDYAPDFHIASICFDKELHELCKFYCQRCIDKEPSFYQAFNLIALSFGEESEYEKGIEYLKQSLEINNNDEYTWLQLGKFQLEIGAFDEAKKTFEKIAKIFPEENSWWIDYAECFASTGDYKQAIDLLRNASSSQNNQSECLYRISDYYFMKEDYISGLTYLEIAYKLFPEGLSDFLDYDERIAEIPEVISFLNETKIKSEKS